MFCNQCEQTARGVACTEIGVCGKDPDIQSLQEILLYGLKGMASYAHHARRLGMTDEGVNAFIEEALFATVTNVNFDMASHIELVMECGRQNLKVMEMLDAGHTKCFGRPSPATVKEGTQAGPGILISGHDMLDLENLLKQTEGTGVKVYTHGEMLPAHMYPGLRKYTSLAGHFGGAWQKQKKEFAEFGGAVLATTNCVLIPREEYRERLFSTRVTAVPGSTVIKDDDYSAVIECAKKCGPLPESIIKESTVGFHHTVLTDAAGAIVKAVQAGELKHFFVIGGCDGAELGRNYFSEYAKATPETSLILTLGCGKYRIRDYDYGSFKLDGVGEIPRLLDMGQCNDAFGAIKVALALSEAFDCGVNDLPLTIVLSWFEQKAVAVLLTLLSLGVKGISIGPKPPAFISPAVFKYLQENFDLRLTGGAPLSDLDQALGKAA